MYTHTKVYILNRVYTCILIVRLNVSISVVTHSLLSNCVINTSRTYQWKLMVLSRDDFTATTNSCLSNITIRIHAILF